MLLRKVALEATKREHLYQVTARSSYREPFKMLSVTVVDGVPHVLVREDQNEREDKQYVVVAPEGVEYNPPTSTPGYGDIVDYCVHIGSFEKDGQTFHAFTVNPERR